MTADSRKRSILHLRMPVAVLALATSVLGFDAVARAQEVLWSRHYGSERNEWAESVEPTPDGGFILCGYGSQPTGDWDVRLIKTDRWGEPEWDRSYGVPGTTEIGTCARPTRDGGYIVAVQEGFCNLLYLDENGDSLWTADYGIRANSVSETSDGGFVVAGDSVGTCCLIKTGPTGQARWRRFFPCGDFSSAFSVVETSDEGFATGGSTWSELGQWDYQVVRTNETGFPLWSRSYGRVLANDEGYALCETDSGGFVITGLFFGTLEIDAVGDSVRSGYYGAGEMGCAFSICGTIDGGFLIGGYVDPFGLDGGDFHLVRTNRQGGVLWETAYRAGADTFENGRCACQTSDGAYIMTGWTDAYGSGDMDIWLVRIDAEVSGLSDGPDARRRTVQDPDDGAIVSCEYLGPNPVRAVDRPVEISLRLPAAARVTTETYDTVGRLVDILDHGILPEGRSSLRWDAPISRRLPEGVYLLNIRAGQETAAHKIVLVR